MRLAVPSVFITTFSLLSFSVVTPVFAETSVHVSNTGEDVTTNVKVQNNTGTNTVCVNNNCTTSGNTTESNSTVCINGKCTTTNGNVVAHADDGNAHVEVNNTTNKTEVKKIGEGEVKAAQDKVASRKKEIEKEVAAKKEALKAKKEELEKRKKAALEEAKKFDIGVLIEEKIKSFFASFFK